MNSYRQSIIRQLADNNIFLDSKNLRKKGEHRDGTLINSAIFEGALLLFDPKTSRWGAYEKVAEDPLPFMIFLLKLMEWKKSLEKT